MPLFHVCISSIVATKLLKLLKADPAVIQLCHRHRHGDVCYSRWHFGGKDFSFPYNTCFFHSSFICPHIFFLHLSLHLQLERISTVTRLVSPSCVCISEDRHSRLLHMSFSKTAKSLTTCIAVAPADGGRILQILPHFWVFSFAFITKIVISYDRNTFISIGEERAGFGLRTIWDCRCPWQLSTSRTAPGRSKMGALLIQLGLRLLLADVQLQEKEMDKMELSWQNPPNPVVATGTCFRTASQIKLLHCTGRSRSELMERRTTAEQGEADTSLMLDHTQLKLTVA